MLAWIAGVVTMPLEWTRIVWPSGSALATVMVPMVVPPPGRFSMTIVWPVCAATCSNTVRGTRSVALPAPNGTMTRTGLVGQVCAAAGSASNRTGHKTASRCIAFFIDLLSFPKVYSMP